MVNVQVRRATPEDAERIAEIKVLGWRAAYAGLLPDTTLNALSAADQADLFRARIADSVTGDSPIARVAESDRDVIGYVAWARTVGTTFPDLERSMRCMSILPTGGLVPVEG